MRRSARATGRACAGRGAADRTARHAVGQSIDAGLPWCLESPVRNDDAQGGSRCTTGCKARLPQRRWRRRSCRPQEWPSRVLRLRTTLRWRPRPRPSCCPRLELQLHRQRARRVEAGGVRDGQGHQLGHASRQAGAALRHGRKPGSSVCAERAGNPAAASARASLIVDSRRLAARGTLLPPALFCAQRSGKIAADTSRGVPQRR